MFTSFHLPKYKYSELTTEAKNQAKIEAEKILIDDYKEELALNGDLMDWEITHILMNKQFSDSEILSRINTLSYDWSGRVV